MIEDFMSVLEDYAGVNMHSAAGRESVARALVKYMCDHHIVTYTNLETAQNDPAMVEFMKNCGCKANQMDLPFERGL